MDYGASVWASKPSPIFKLSRIKQLGTQEWTMISLLQRKNDYVITMMSSCAL